MKLSINADWRNGSEAGRCGSVFSVEATTKFAKSGIRDAESFFTMTLGWLNEHKEGGVIVHEYLIEDEEYHCRADAMLTVARVQGFLESRLRNMGSMASDSVVTHQSRDGGLKGAPPNIDPLETDLAAVLNKHSAENESDTPDFVLAQYLMTCLRAFDEATLRRDAWYEPDDGDVDVRPEKRITDARLGTGCRHIRSGGTCGAYFMENNEVRICPNAFIGGTISCKVVELTDGSYVHNVSWIDPVDGAEVHSFYDEHGEDVVITSAE